MSGTTAAGLPPAPGMLLVAAPTLLDPNFVDTVVLLLDADDEGAIGVVLNRPTPVPVEEVLPDWGPVVAEPEVLFQGGPVSTEGALAVALLEDGVVVVAELGRRTGHLADAVGVAVGELHRGTPHVRPIRT